MTFTVEQTWGSHKPILTAVLETLPIRTAIECGCGEYSTSLFNKYVPDLITIEHDPAWAQQVVAKFPASEHHHWIVEPVRGMNGTPREWYPEGAFEAGLAFYERLGKSLPRCDVLFVDTFRVFRVPAVVNLGPLADIILLHDLGGVNPDYYGYRQLADPLRGRRKYMFRPPGMIDAEHPVSWTALYSWNELPVKQLQEIATRESMALWGVDGLLEPWDGTF